MSNLIFNNNGMTISVNENGLYSLNDLHKASGGDPKNSPSRWLRTKIAQDLIRSVEKRLERIESKSHNRLLVLEVNHGGSNQGAYIHELLVVSYAGWINPDFQIEVNHVFLEATRSKIKALEDEKRKLIVQKDNRRRDDLARANMKNCYGFNKEVNQAIRLIIAGISMKDKTYLEIVQSKNCMPEVFKEAWGYIERNLVRCINPEASEFGRIYTLLK